MAMKPDKCPRCGYCTLDTIQEMDRGWCDNCASLDSGGRNHCQLCHNYIGNTGNMYCDTCEEHLIQRSQNKGCGVSASTVLFLGLLLFAILTSL